jgi:RNA polymerase sigma factor (sigma-70 family)
MSDWSDSSWSHLFDRLADGGDAIREEILSRSQQHVRKMASRMLRRFQNVRALEETDDVLNNVLLRLTTALRAIPIDSRAEYFRLAATHIRWELLDLARRYRHQMQHNVPLDHDHEPAPTNLAATVDEEVHQMNRWEQWHQAIEALPAEEQAVCDLIWYHGLSATEAAEMLGITERTARRRWQSARCRLYDALDGELPA